MQDSHSCDCLKKEADWAVAEKVEVRWESQIENFSKKDGYCQESQKCKEKKNRQAVLKKGTKPYDKV